MEYSSRGKIWIRTPAVAAMVFAIALAGCAGDSGGGAESTPAAGETVAKASISPVERGQYLVTVASCNDCHTPWKMGANGPEPDMTRMLSGHPGDIAITEAPALAGGYFGWLGSNDMTAFAGPWGVSFSANLTPDLATGLGGWDAAMFKGAMRNGKHMGSGRPLLPPMPWFNLAQATDEDLDAIFAYLQSIPAISNKVPDPIPPAGGGMGQ